MSSKPTASWSPTSVFKQNKSPLLQRKEQVSNWVFSPTNKEKSTFKISSDVKFSLDVCFLSACGEGDVEDAKMLLEKGANINTKNIDGITALHQACLDDNDEIVEFLLENDVNLNVQDMEGWTPLHAAVYCGFANIAECLIQRGADPGIPNNCGELPLDLADEEAISAVLRQSIEERHIDVDGARNRERNMMMADALQLRKKDPKTTDLTFALDPTTKATPLHVAAAKGYTDVISVLLEIAHSMLEAKDVDGWTPLHAAVHWGQKEAIRQLCEQGANLDSMTFAMQTPADLADADMKSYLRQLKYGVQMRSNTALNNLSSADKKLLANRRSSVNRLSMDQKTMMRMNKEKSLVANLMEMLMLKKTLSGVLPIEETETSAADEGESIDELIKSHVLKINKQTSQEKPRPSSSSSQCVPSPSPESTSLKSLSPKDVLEDRPRSPCPSPKMCKVHSTLASQMLGVCVVPWACTQEFEKQEGEVEKSDPCVSPSTTTLKESQISIDSVQSNSFPSMIVHEDEPETPQSIKDLAQVFLIADDTNTPATEAPDDTVFMRAATDHKDDGEKTEEFVHLRKSQINSLIVKSNNKDWRADRNAISEYDEESDTVKRISLLMAPKKSSESESQRITKARQSLSSRRSTQGEITTSKATSNLIPVDETDNTALVEQLQTKIAELEKANADFESRVASLTRERELQLKTIERFLAENEEIRSRLKASEEENATLKRQSTMGNLREENVKLREENSALVRVISRLSKTRDQDDDVCHRNCDRPHDEHFSIHTPTFTKL